jgi:tRNA modification GTPase
MLVEATLDFPEEEIDFLRKADARGQLSNLQQTLAGVLQRAGQGLARGHQGGHRRPAQRRQELAAQRPGGAELAIVTPIAGTTRDGCAQTIQIEACRCIIDTAGLRESSDEVERIGIARLEEIASADAVLFLHDLTRLDAPEYQLPTLISQAIWPKTAAPCR